MINFFLIQLDGFMIRQRKSRGTGLAIIGIKIWEIIKNGN